MTTAHGLCKVEGPPGPACDLTHRTRDVECVLSELLSLEPSAGWQGQRVLTAVLRLRRGNTPIQPTRNRQGRGPSSCPGMGIRAGRGNCKGRFSGTSRWLSQARDLPFRARFHRWPLLGPGIPAQPQRGGDDGQACPARPPAFFPTSAILPTVRSTSSCSPSKYTEGQFWDPHTGFLLLLP